MARGWRIFVPSMLLLAVGAAAMGASAPTDKVISSIDLTKAFQTRSTWRFTATQGPQIEDDTYADRLIDGKIRFCLHRAGSSKCDPAVDNSLTHNSIGDYYDEPHFLGRVGVVYPSAGRPLFLLRWSGPSSGDGSHGIMTQVLTYDRSNDRFRSVYKLAVGSNGNEEVRFISTGPLQGTIISAEPTDNAPYGYWVIVSRPGKDLSYRQVLRYRSATHYNDGNQLAVIDSEMPNIERRLGLWKRGERLPPPPAGCKRPRLVHGALWCG